METCYLLVKIYYHCQFFFGVIIFSDTAILIIIFVSDTVCKTVISHFFSLLFRYCFAIVAAIDQLYF